MSAMAASRSTVAARRFVLPIQAKVRIAQPFRAAFDYHCKTQHAGRSHSAGHPARLHFLTTAF